jgi:hypothetical protein
MGGTASNSEERQALFDLGSTNGIENDVGALSVG